MLESISRENESGIRQQFEITALISVKNPCFNLHSWLAAAFIFLKRLVFPAPSLSPLMRAASFTLSSERFLGEGCLLKCTRSRSGLILVLAGLLVAHASSANSGAETRAPQSLLIRYRSRHALQRLELPDNLTAQKERTRLERLPRSFNIERVSINHLYRPALHLQPRAVTESAPRAMFTDLPTGADFANALPDVLQPPDQAVPGFAGEDPLFSQDWAMQSIRLPSLDSSEIPNPVSTPAAAPITVAVIDTGIDYNHEDLMPALWRHPDDPREVGYDFVHGHSRPYDLYHFDIQGCQKNTACRLGINEGKFIPNPGHGTHCAGHIGAVAGNALGIRGVGAQWSPRDSGVSVMTLKFIADFGEKDAGQGDDAAAVQSIDYAIRNGAKIISASWGGLMEREEAEASELKQALIRAQAAGVLVVIAAGNEGIDQDSQKLTPEGEKPLRGYPAGYDLDNLIVVAAVDRDDRLAEFSNYGAQSVHLAAPGVKILSTIVEGVPFQGQAGRYGDVVARYFDSKGREQQMDWDGTSMATPIVAGAVAAVWARHPHEDYHRIRERVLNSTRPSASLLGKTTTGGILDVAAALKN
jgi:thermitase